MSNGFKRKTNSGVPFYSCGALDATGLALHGFSTRHGGVSRGDFGSMNLGRSIEEEKENIRKNRRLFCRAVGVLPENVRFARQVHSDNIFTVLKPSDIVPHGAEYDGFITNLKNIPLMIFMADCLPLLMLDCRKKVIAAVHCGWRGTAADIAGKAVRLMVSQYSSAPEDIIAAIGPCIMPCHFLTREDVPEAMFAQYGQKIAPHIKRVGEKYAVSLAAINAHALEREGVARENIHISGLCTSCDQDEFFSHRIMGFNRGVCAGVISLI